LSTVGERPNRREETHRGRLRHRVDDQHTLRPGLDRDVEALGTEHPDLTVDAKGLNLG
jgi:hypothetical protein